MTNTELQRDAMDLWECPQCPYTCWQPLHAKAMSHVPDIQGVRRAAHRMRRALPGPHVEGEPGRTTVAQHP